jgi:hypothetical protein
MLRAKPTGTGGQDDEMDMGFIGAGAAGGLWRRGESAHARRGAADGDGNRNRDDAADRDGNRHTHHDTDASAYPYCDSPVVNTYINSYTHSITNPAADRPARPAPHQCRPTGSVYP